MMQNYVEVCGMTAYFTPAMCNVEPMFVDAQNFGDFEVVCLAGKQGQATQQCIQRRENCNLKW